MSSDQDSDDAHNAELSRAEIASVHPFKDHVVLRGEAEARSRAANGCIPSKLGYACPCTLGAECVA